MKAHAAAIEDTDPMAALERSVPLSGFVESSTGPVGGGANVGDHEKIGDGLMDNPDAIELGYEEEME